MMDQHYEGLIVYKKEIIIQVHVRYSSDKLPQVLNFICMNIIFAEAVNQKYQANGSGKGSGTKIDRFRIVKSLCVVDTKTI